MQPHTRVRDLASGDQPENGLQSNPIHWMADCTRFKAVLLETLEAFLSLS